MWDKMSQITQHVTTEFNKTPYRSIWNG